MAEDTASEQGTEGTTQTPPAEASGQERTFTQAELDERVRDRLKRERAKYAGYVDGSKVEEANARADKAEAELADLKAKEKRHQLVADVADKAGVPVEVVSMLVGTDADELAAQVDRLLELLPAYPTRTDDGGSHRVAAKTNEDRFADALFGR